jgi:hypothetical protein
MARSMRFERMAFASGGQRSIQLSYERKKREEDNVSKNILFR